MMVFFYFTKGTKVNHIEHGQVYEHVFEGIPDPKQEQIDFKQVYFSTPSDFNTHIQEIKRTHKGDIEELVKIIDPQAVANHPSFPRHIGFGKLEEQLLPFKGRKELKICILNAMSNAIGDHLIGMQAFNYWQEKVKELLPQTEVKIAFFQLNPVRLKAVTKQWWPKFDEIFMMPNRHSRFVEYDAFVDLGSLIARENFGTQPMIDFFYEALSFDPNEIPVERKRIRYVPKEENSKKMEAIIKVIRSRGRPILLFHRTSTSAIREMRPLQARRTIKKILDNSDYFVVSADGLDYSHDRFMDLSPYSTDIDSFASIIQNIDSIITVDTSTYHFADAFNKPTVVLFTSIEPDLRVRYYPYTESIMLEEKDGLVYGEHHVAKKEEEYAKQVAYVDEKWDAMDINEVLSKLKKMEEKCEV